MSYFCGDHYRGQVNVVDPESDLKLGEMVYLTDKKALSGGRETRNYSMHTHARLVKNAGAALTPGHTASWVAKTGMGTQVSGNAGNGVMIDGIVDPDIPSGTTVATGDYFLLLVHGPATAIASGAGMDVGQFIIGGSVTGKIKTVAIGDASGSGRILEDADAKTNGATVRVFLMCEHP